MAMGPETVAAIVLAAVDAVLLAALSVVWIRNYRTFRSQLTLGLLAFALVLLTENLVAVYFFFSMGSLYAGGPLVAETVLLMRGLEFVAILFLTYVTMQ